MTKPKALKLVKAYNARRPFADSPKAYVFYSGKGYEALVCDEETGSVLHCLQPVESSL